MAEDNVRDNKLSIRSWQEEDRPREKLSLKGKEALSDAELLAILLGSGTTQLSVVDVAKLLLKEANNSLVQLSQMSVKDLCKTPGIGPAKAITVLAAAELGRRRKADKSIHEPLSSSAACFRYVYPLLADLDHERFYAILLNRRHIPLRHFQVSSGGVSSTVVDPKVIFKKALEQDMASSIILAHNHPSGSLVPSRNDRLLTERIVKAGQLLDMSILDHIIVGYDEYFSFADEGIMPK